jgi:preprotein translocase subunit SecY
MSWKDTAEPVLTRLPAIRRPDGHVPFRRKLGWTAGILVLYFFLTNVLLFGVGTSNEVFGRFRSILAGSSGSLMQVGIGPIVTASIVLQLLGGSDLLGLDTQNNPRDQVLYQGLQKFLVIIMTALTAIPMVYAGFLTPDGSVANSLGIGIAGLEILIFFQVFVGGILILYMDEVVSKWGIGSGIGLFIIAGVSQRLISGLLAMEPIINQPDGIVEDGILVIWAEILLGVRERPNPITPGGFEDLIFGEPQLLAIFTTVAIFVIVVYAESVRVEIPLSNARVKGARGRFPVKLIYASVLPMILVRALQMNIQFMGQGLNSAISMPSWLGVYVDGSPVDGLFYYLAPIQSPQDWMWFAYSVEGSPEIWQILLRVSVDLSVMIVGGAIFAIFWVRTTNMGPEATAQQIHGSGMQIPGFRQNVQSIERVLEQYIPQVTVIGGALVGVLAVGANMFGTIGNVTGTGLLLTVSITYKLYEQIAEEQLMEMHPMMRKMFG